MTEGFINNVETAFKIQRKVLSSDLQGQGRSEKFYPSVGSVFVFFEGIENCNSYYTCIDRTEGKSCCQPQPVPSLAEAESFQEQPLVSSSNTKMVAASHRHLQTKVNIQNLMRSLMLLSKMETMHANVFCSLHNINKISRLWESLV